MNQNFSMSSGRMDNISGAMVDLQATATTYICGCKKIKINH